MKKTVVLFFYLIFIGLNISAQSGESIEVPKKKQKKVHELVNYLTKDLDTERAKVDVVYNWVVNNIEYDVDEITSEKPFELKSGSSILKKKKAICMGYASLMKDMLAEIGIESQAVDGYIHSSVVDSGKVLIQATHTWLAVKIDGDWFLTDPTWGAGYVGNMKTDKEEKFGKKRLKLEAKFGKKETKLATKENKAKSDKKRAAVQTKIKEHKLAWDEAKNALEEEYKEAEDFTGERGFVKDPNHYYHLVHPDSFLLSHLPINPMWQLKADTIGIRSFSKGKDFIKKYRPKNNHYPFKEKIDEYQKLLFFDQLIWSADDGFIYNPANSAPKVFNYYNYLTIKTDKVIQKKIGTYDADDVKQKLDTISKHISMAENASKEEFNRVKKYYKILNKQDDKRHSLLLKSASKLREENKKTADRIITHNQQLKDNFKSLDSKADKLRGKASNTKLPIDTTKILNLLDSIHQQLDQLSEYEKEWISFQKESSLQGLVNSIDYHYYLLEIRNKYLSFQDYHVNEHLNKIDSIIDVNEANIRRYYIDSLSIEMLKKEWYKSVKGLNNFLSYTKKELGNLKTKQKIDNVSLYLIFFEQKVLKSYEKMLAHINQALNHNKWMERLLDGKFDNLWRDVKGAIKDMEDLNEKRYEISLNDTNYAFKRSQNLYQMVESDMKKLKAELKRK